MAQWDPTIPSPRMFWEFCSLRMDEWWNRQAGGPPPYTKDKVLQVKPIPYVFRDLDYETRWMHEQLDSRLPHEIVFGSIAFRLTAKVPLHQKFGGIPRPEQMSKFENHLYWARDQGIPMFTRIYFTPSLFRYVEAMTDIATHAKSITEEMCSYTQMQKAFRVLAELPRVKTFYGWQVMADLIESKVLPFDENEWAYLGPGPIRAFTMMYGEKPSQERALAIARKMRDVQHKALSNTIIPWKPPPHIPELTLKNIEHALCEYFRWVNAHWQWRGK